MPSPPTKPRPKGTKLPNHKILGEQAPVGNLLPPEPLPVEYDIFVVGTDKKVESYLVAVEICDASLTMEIDTGSTFTLAHYSFESSSQGIWSLWDRSQRQAWYIPSYTHSQPSEGRGQQ